MRIGDVNKPTQMPKKEAILLELQYLPPIHYFAKMVQYGEVWIEQWEHYSKGSYRNRCHIATANGLMRLSVPLEKGKNEQMPIREVRIAYEEPWQRQHWAGIRSAYGRAPFFDFYTEELAPFFAMEWEYLFDFNAALLQKLVELAGVSVPLKYTETYWETPPADILDFRNSIFPKKHRQKTDPHFAAPKYRQLFEERHGFMPNLSILDLLFCTGPQTLLYLESAIVHSENKN